MSEQNTKQIDPAKVAKKKAKKEAREQAFQSIFKIAETTKNEELKKALMALKPSLYGIRVGGNGGGNAAHDSFLAKFAKVGDTIKEVDIFTETGAGRPACNGYIKKGLKKAVPAQRKWVRFDAEKRSYTLVAIGEKTPADWTGYVPTEVDVEELK